MLLTGASGFAAGSLPLRATALEHHHTTHRLPLSAFPLGSDDQPAEPRYPGARPNGSFVVRDGRVLPVLLTPAGWRIGTGGTADAPVTEDLDDWLTRLGEVPLSERLASVGYGSNLNPREIDRFSEDRAVVVLRAAVVGVQSAYLTKPRSRDHQFPAGLAIAEPAHVEAHGIVLIDPRNQSRLDGKEGQGGAYLRSVISAAFPLAAVLEDATMLVAPLPTYLQHEKKLAGLDGRPLALADVEQREFAALVESRRVSALPDSGLISHAIDRLPHLVTRPVPYFVYGTLRPGESRWAPISHLVDYAEPAEVTGRRFDTGYGYPGLTLDGTDIVDGMLLHPAAKSHHELRMTLDSIEGHPHLYTRTLVRLINGAIAWIYVWNGSSD